MTPAEALTVTPGAKVQWLPPAGYGKLICTGNMYPERCGIVRVVWDQHHCPDSTLKATDMRILATIKLIYKKPDGD